MHQGKELKISQIIPRKGRKSDRKRLEGGKYAWLGENSKIRMPKSRKGAPGVSGRSRCRWQGQIVGGSASLTAVVFVDGCQEGHTKGLIAGCSRSSEAVISMSERTPTAQTPAHTSIRNAIFFFPRDQNGGRPEVTNHPHRQSNKSKNLLPPLRG